MTLVFNPIKLIEEIKARPGLYSERLERHEKLELWKEVGAAIFPDWGECNKSVVYGRVLQLQKKWKSLRDAYNRELRIRKEEKDGTKRSRIVYRYFKIMTFLGGFDGNVSSDEGSTGGQELSNYTQAIEDDSDPQFEETKFKPRKFKEESVEDLPVLKKIKKIKKKRRKRQRSEDDEMDTQEMEMPMPMFPMEFPGEDNNDSDKLFLLSFVPEMRQLPVNIKMWARAQIANIMQEAVSSQYNNSKPGRSQGNEDVKRYKSVSDSPIFCSE